MARYYTHDGHDEALPVERSTLSVFTLLLGWMGAHKFYVGKDTLGGFYFAVTVLGLVLTLYEPIWVPVWGFHINLAVLILIAPLVVSIIEFFNIRRWSDGELHQRYHRSGGSLTLVFVTQFIFLILLFLPVVYRAFSQG